MDLNKCATGVILALVCVAWTASARADAVSDAKAAVARYTGPQTKWEGQTAAPKPMKGMSLVYLSGDETNDICHEYGAFMTDAARQLGWTVTVIDGKGTPSGWAAGFEQGIALKPNGIAICADARSLGQQIKTAKERGIVVIGFHGASLPGPNPELGLFVNIQQDPREIGKAQGQWAIADSGGTARVVIITHNEYKIAETKSGATKASIEACAGCKVLEVADYPASEDSARMPQLTTTWVQKYGLPLYITSVGDQAFDFAVPVLRGATVDPSQVKLVGADGNRSAYERIRAREYQLVTVSEPIELQAYQAVDEFNRAFNRQPPSGFVQAPYLVTPNNVDKEGGAKNTFVPTNDYKKHYLAIWGVGG
jgi:ribose transport system substrate-binding protein